MNMSMSSIVQQATADFGSWCHLKTQSAPAPRPVFMIVRREGEGSPGSRSILSAMISSSSRRDNASIGYGLLLANDAPEDMSSRSKLTIIDGVGKVWQSDRARAVMDRDEVDGRQFVAAWRLLLWETQSTTGAR